MFFGAVQTSDQKKKVTFFDVKKKPHKNLFFMIGLEKSFFLTFSVIQSDCVLEIGMKT